MSIGGFADLLQEHAGGQLDDKGRQYLRAVLKSSDQLARLLGEVMAYARLGGVEMRPGVVDLGDLVRVAVHELDPAKGGRAVDWEVPALAAVAGDAALLRVAVAKLLANALKFTCACVVARIRVGTLAGPGETIFFVRDNGVGFDPAQRDRLFDVFQRLHAPADFPGTGLGLACVRRIIQRHGGRTWAEGKAGEGATFYFSLPAGTPAKG
jgi:light-regulated signal transduction histidine kinase (bacteriophytochrome)